MPHVNVPFAIEGVLWMRALEQELRLTLGFRSTSAIPTFADCVNTVDILTAFSTDLMVLLSSQVELYRLSATAEDTDHGFQQIVDVSLFGSITATEMLPLNVAALVRIDPIVRGRGRKGRNFVPGLTEGWWDGFRFVSGLVDDLTTVYAELTGSLAGGLQWAVISRTAPHVGVVPVASFQVQSTPHTQKLRLPGARRRRHHI